MTTINEQKLEREIEKRRRESPRERQKRLAKYAEERDHDHAFLSEIPVAFVFRMSNQGPPESDGVWLLEGRPKPDYTPSNREGKVLAGMNFKFWIDKATCQWLRIEAEVQHPVSIFGLFAKVGPGTKFTLAQFIQGSLNVRFIRNEVIPRLGAHRCTCLFEEIGIESPQSYLAYRGHPSKCPGEPAA